MRKSGGKERENLGVGGMYRLSNGQSGNETKNRVLRSRLWVFWFDFYGRYNDGSFSIHTDGSVGAQQANQFLGSGQWAMRRAIKGSLLSPAITELLLWRNYLGNETNLKLTALGKPDVHYMETLTHTHTYSETPNLVLMVLAVGFTPLHVCTYAHRHPHVQQTPACA